MAIKNERVFLKIKEKGERERISICHLGDKALVEASMCKYMAYKNMPSPAAFG